MDKCACNEEIALGYVGTEMCGYSKRIFAYIQGNNLRLFSEEPGGAEGDIEINYCPLCGRKLKKRSYLLHKPAEASDKAKTRYA